MYPPLAKVDYAQLLNAFSNRKLLLLSLFQNWVVGPLLMFVLALVFLPEFPGYQRGLILIGIARCIAMVVVWSDLAKGDKNYTAALVALNAVFQVLFYSIYAWLFGTWLPTLLDFEANAIPVSIGQIAESVAIYLGLPFLLGFLSWYLLPKVKSKAWFQTKYLPSISPITLVFLLLTIVLMFSLKSEKVIELPMDTLRIAIPLTLYFCIMFFAAFSMSLRAGADYSKATSLAFTAAGNNFELGIAVAISAFGLESDEAFATIIGPLIEVPVLLLLAKWALAKEHKKSAA
jgi:ACR3 family arsenite transporter